VDADAAPGTVTNVALGRADNAPASSGRAPVQIAARHGVKGVTSRVTG
jgi:hypothetical protein